MRFSSVTAATLSSMAGMALAQSVSTHDVATCGKAEAAARALAQRFAPREDPLGDCLACDVSELTDLLHCNLDIEIAPGPNTITGSNTFRIRSRTDNLTSFTFRLRSQFVISSALINGTTPVVVSTPSTTTRTVTLDRPYNTDEVFTLTIQYSGVPVSVGGFGSVQFSSQGGYPLVQTLSQPYYAYTWWPCKDGDVGEPGDYSDKFTMDFAITAPEALSSVAAGTLQGIDPVAGGKRKMRWSTGYPIPTYLVFFCSTVYNQWQRSYNYPLPGGGNGVMPVQFSIYPSSDTPSNRAGWERSVDMLATFRPLFGEYPFIAEKYGIYEFGFGGGMEHQTYTGQGGFGESLTAHELAHQWWGDDVTCRTWHDIWLNEGFATYAEALWIQYKPGSTGWPAYFAAMEARLPAALSGTVYRTDISNVSSIFSTSYSYRKPAWVLHSLRRVVGEQTFFDILAAHRAAYSGSGVTTDEFIALASTVAGRDLGWFFQEWIYGPGAPAYAYGWQNAIIGGQNYLRIHLRQTHTAYPVFTMPIDLRITTPSGVQTVTLWNDAGAEWFLVPVPAAASAAVLDPDAWILSTARASEPYAAGPPKIVTASPAPGEVLQPGPQAGRVAVLLSQDATVPAGALTLAGPGGAVPATLVYEPATQTATLTPDSQLAPGLYTVTVRDTVVSGAFGLDGEIQPSLGAGAFPSGNGQPGGAAEWTFTVQAPECYPNCDESTAVPVLNVADFTCFLQRYAAGETYANCDESTAQPVLNVADFTCFLQRYAAGCP